MSMLQARASGVRAWPLLVLVSLGLLTDPAGALPPPSPNAAPADGRKVGIYHLRSLQARDAARVVLELFGRPAGRAGGLVVTADERTNSLLVSAAARDLAEVEAVLQKIDVPGSHADAGRPALQVLPLRHVEAGPALEAALRMLLPNSRTGHFVVDREHRQVIAYADRPILDEVKGLLTWLDVEAEGRPTAAAADRQVHVYWVVSESGKGEAGKLPEDLQEAAAELLRLGLDRPRLAAQVTVTSAPEAPFEMTGHGGPDLPYRLAITGVLSDKQGATGLDVSITVTREPAGRGPTVVCRLHTRLSVIPDRPVVLGATPADGLKFALVVQVQGGKPARPSGQRARAAGQPAGFELHFRNASWKQVLEWLTESTGLPLVGSPPPGTFTFTPPRPGRTYRLPEMLDILNDALLQQKYLLLRRERAFLVIPADERIEPSLVPHVRPEELGQRGRTELVSLSVRLKKVSAQEVAPDVRKLLGPFGEVHVLQRANELVLQDTAGNLQRIYALLRELEEGGRK